MTLYHFDFAADRWHPALDIEADRMRNIRIDGQSVRDSRGQSRSQPIRGGF